MSYSDYTDSALVHELQAQRDWLRTNANAPRWQQRDLQKKIRAMEAEIAERGLAIAASTVPEANAEAARLGLTSWFVGFHHDRPGQPLASSRRHHDRHCRGIVEHYSDADVRTVTEAEFERLPPCKYCSE